MESRKRKYSTPGDLSFHPSKKNLESWFGILGRDISAHSSQSEQQMADALFKSTVNDVEKDHVNRRFGNKYALDRMDEIEGLKCAVRQLQAESSSHQAETRRLQAETNSLQAETNSLQAETNSLRAESEILRAAREDVFDLRRHVLEGRDEYLDKSIDDKKSRDKRNDTAHGGNINVDHILLEDMRQNSCDDPAKYGELFKVYQENFRRLYSLDSRITTKMIQEAPKSVLHVYDVRAHVRVMGRWRKAKGETKKLADRVEEACDLVTGHWEEWVTGLETGLGLNADGKAREIRELFDSFRLKEEEEKEKKASEKGR